MGGVTMRFAFQATRFTPLPDIVKNMKLNRIVRGMICEKTSGRICLTLVIFLIVGH
jgi:hypothetical protein